MAKKAAQKRLAGFGKLDRNMETKHVDDLLGIELNIANVVFKAGEHGEFCVFEATDDQGEIHTIVSGAAFVVDALHDVEDQNAFPIAVSFYKHGRTVLFE